MGEWAEAGREETQISSENPEELARPVAWAGSAVVQVYMVVAAVREEAATAMEKVVANWVAEASTHREEPELFRSADDHARCAASPK